MQQGPIKESEVGVDPTVLSRFVQTYLVMAVAGLVGCTFMHDNLLALFKLPGSWQELGYLTSLTLLGIGLLVACQDLCKQLFPAYAVQRLLLARMLGPLGLSQAVCLALLSAVAEELMFRGAMQPLLGVATTSLILALLHISSDRMMAPVMLATLATSLVLGCLFYYSQSLYPSLLAHLVLNGAFLVRHAVGRRGIGPLTEEREPPL